MAQGQSSSSAAASTPSPSTTATTASSSSQPVMAEHDLPIVLDLGSKSRKQIRRLRKGRGKLMNRVNTVVEELKTNGNISATAQPIIIVVKQRKDDGILGMFN
ncbi:MAG TPA: hypothetical protein VGJ82_08105 [Thermoanaerobaculia bacterium]|jgi:hypothetical protein